MGAVEIRAHLPGELGWVVGRHGRCYARDHGFAESFEALVPEVLAFLTGAASLMFWSFRDLSVWFSAFSKASRSR